MNLQHVNVKVFVEDPEAVDQEGFIEIFNGWIKARDSEALLVDVADYRHVFGGPGVLLIGHEANYSLDNAGGRLGLLYNRKAQIDGTTQERLRQAVGAALRASRRLEVEEGLRFRGQEVQLVVNDRLVAPNTDETLAALAPDLTALFSALFAGAEYRLARSPDPRERFTINVKTSAEFDVETLLKNLDAERLYA